MDHEYHSSRCPLSFVPPGDGRLEIDELMRSLHIINAHSLRGPELRKAFETFDTNGDGYIR